MSKAPKINPSRARERSRMDAISTVIRKPDGTVVYDGPAEHKKKNPKKEGGR